MSLQTAFKSLSITRFLEEVDSLGLFWIIKRLSGNDTNLTGSHQSGLYLPKKFVEVVFPDICTTEKYNPDAYINTCYLPQADLHIKKLRAVYYNSKYFPERQLKKKYDEFRLTRWGGRNAPPQDPENTGSIFLLAIQKTADETNAVAWVASSITEEDTIEAWLGEEVEPGRFLTKPSRKEGLVAPAGEFDLPAEWLVAFPSGREIFCHVMELVPRATWVRSVDELLLKRREIEFKLFAEIEKREVLPEIQQGFDSIDSFIKLAHSVSNRRKSRAGTSLELNLETIFLDDNVYFETQVYTENRKRPDFIFPSSKAYHDERFPTIRLHMLAAKTCCKDRWRQVLNEADRITSKHLFTLQQGVSNNQLKEMRDHNISLVVPKPFIESFPKESRKSLLTLDDFISLIRTHQSSVPDLCKWIN